MAVRHLLLDADGVVQTSAGDFLGALTAHLGEGAVDFLAATFPADSPVLRGEAEVVPLLRAALATAGKDVDVDRLYDDVWLAIEVHRPTLELVTALRAQGYGVHLGTNQDSARARHMRATLGYDDVFDTCFYSCELGAAKPFPEFFRAVLAAIDAEPGEVLFVDDSATYVAGAREVGLHAEEWSIADGDDGLRRLLARHDVKPG